VIALGSNIKKEIPELKLSKATINNETLNNIAVKETKNIKVISHKRSKSGSKTKKKKRNPSTGSVNLTKKDYSH
jgi:hypothetical protein